MLYRQIHPEKFSKGKPGMLNFVPGKSNFIPEDGLNLSTRREDIGPQGAHEAHVALGLKSAGTWGFTVHEADQANAPGLLVYDDEGLGAPPAPPFHMTVRYPEGLTRGKQERIAKRLYAAAEKHGVASDGWLYRP